MLLSYQVLLCVCVFRFLNYISELTHSAQSDDLWKFLDAVYQSKVPDPGGSFKITINNGRSVSHFYRWKLKFQSIANKL